VPGETDHETDHGSRLEMLIERTVGMVPHMTRAMNAQTAATTGKN
jgi:hypothetical protein